MKANVWILVCSYLLVGVGCQEESPFPEQGVPKTLAESRSATIEELHYDLLFNLPNDEGSLVTGKNLIRFRLPEKPKADLFIDFTGELSESKSYKVNGKLLQLNIVNQHIRIPRRFLNEGENTIEIDFISSDQALNRNPDFLFTLFVPDKARTAFPCFDQPDLKARFSLKLDLPQEWIAVSNGALVDTTDSSKGRQTLNFATTRPISTYLFSFIAGRFTRVVGTVNGKSAAFYHREPDSMMVVANAPKLFELHEHALSWLENYTGINYPFNKFEFVLIPSFQYGGMEHPGNIFYRAARLLLQPDASPAEELGRASLIAHETAHMWFGDLVTMRWFDDVWLKEVFANFFAAKIVNPEFPEIDHESRFILTHYPRAMAVDRSSGTNPIKQELGNLENAGSLYGDIIYYKAPILMQQLEMLAGAQTFRSGMLTYLHSHKYSNASWEDLVTILDEILPVDLKSWSKSWFFESGLPEFNINVEPYGIDSLKVMVVRQPGDEVWEHAQQSFEMSIAYPAGSKEFRCDIKGDTNVFIIEWKRPHTNLLPVLYDGNFYGTHIMKDDDVQEALNIVSQNPKRKTRSAIWVDLHENFLNSRINRNAYISALVTSINAESSPVILSTLLDYLREYFWQFNTGSEREQLATQIEPLLYQRSQEKGLGRLFFQAYRDIAITHEGIESIYNLWAYGHPTLKFNDNDNISLVSALAVRSYTDIDSVIELQKGRFENQDLLAKFEFMLPALSLSQGIWKQFVDNLNDPTNRDHEVWVLDALEAIHHPLRSEESIVLLAECLEMLEDVKRTGDIFFPRNWLDACIGGYSNAQALQIVDEYLQNHPHIPITLRGKVLQASDLLRRSVKMQPYDSELVFSGN